MLQQAVGRVQIHGIGRGDERHLVRGGVRPQRQEIAERTDLINADALALLRGRDLRQIRVGAGGEQPAALAVAAGVAGRRRAVTQERPCQAPGEIMLAQAGRSVQQQPVRQAINCGY